MRNRRRSGITLIEILSVIVLIGLVYGYIISDTQKLFRVSLSSSVERFATVVRYAYNEAVLTGNLHRIIIDMGDPEAPNRQQRWFVQKGNPGALPLDKSKIDRFSRDADKNLAPPKFEESGGRWIAELPKGIKILRVQSWRLGKGRESYREEGQVAIYAYPSGFIDDASLYMMEGKSSQEAQIYIVTINSLTGKIKLESKVVPLDENGEAQL